MRPSLSRLPTLEELQELARAPEILSERYGKSAERAIEGGFGSLRSIHARYLALLRGETPGAPRCKTPWHSALVEPSGEVRPCFFHASYGRLAESGLDSLLNGTRALDFRRNLSVSKDPICRQCVCWKRFGRVFFPVK